MRQQHLQYKKGKNQKVKMAVSLDVKYLNPYIIGHQTTLTIKAKIICMAMKYYYTKQIMITRQHLFLSSMNHEIQVFLIVELAKPYEVNLGAITFNQVSVMMKN